MIITQTVRTMADKKNQNLMQLIKKVHGFVENTDLEKHRQSQNHFGTILSDSRGVTYENVEIGGIHGEWVRVGRAHNRRQIILYCHGGGYSTGSCVYARTITAKLAKITLREVLAFDYRLAPEHPYPAALEDAVRVWDYLMYLGFGARDVIVAGDSAGGNLALVLVHYLKKEKRQLPGGLLLMSPWTELTSSGQSFVGKADMDPVLNKEYIDLMVKAYVVNQDPADFMISPLFGDFEKFPPVYIQAGENEILLDDSRRLADRLREAGASVRMEVFPGMWHVFQMSPFKTAYEAMDHFAEFVYEIDGGMR